MFAGVCVYKIGIYVNIYSNRYIYIYLKLDFFQSVLVHRKRTETKMLAGSRE